VKIEHNGETGVEARTKREALHATNDGPGLRAASVGRPYYQFDRSYDVWVGVDLSQA
jgi:hypothetical protein